MTVSNEQNVRAFEAVRRDMQEKQTCINCGWKGVALDIMRIDGGKEACPACLSESFIMSANELKQSHWADELCPF